MAHAVPRRPAGKNRLHLGTATVPILATRFGDAGGNETGTGVNVLTSTTTVGMADATDSPDKIGGQWDEILLVLPGGEG